MPRSRAPVTDEDRLEALVLLQRYARELEAVAASVLGTGPTSALDLQVLLAVDRVDRVGGGASPSMLVQRLGIPRSTLARSLSRLRRAALVERRADPLDARRARLAASDTGRARVLRCEQALADFLTDGAAVVKEVMLLLGRDPEAVEHRPVERGVREVADRIHRTGSRYVRDVREALVPYGVTETADRYALAYLALRDGRPSGLAEHLDLTPAGTTSLLDRLEAHGLVERRSGELAADRRAVLVRLTPRGRHAADRVLEVFARHHTGVLDALAPATRPLTAPGGGR